VSDLTLCSIIISSRVSIIFKISSKRWIRKTNVIVLFSLKFINFFLHFFKDTLTFRLHADFALWKLDMAFFQVVGIGRIERWVYLLYVLLLPLGYHHLVHLVSQSNIRQFSCEAHESHTNYRHRPAPTTFYTNRRKVSIRKLFKLHNEILTFLNKSRWEGVLTRWMVPLEPNQKIFLLERIKIELLNEAAICRG
jgi:hypothetical protein